ncbi:MAG: pentapeptide repeat-containing protein [Carbonactinosporaceae bacterium]
MSPDEREHVDEDLRRVDWSLRELTGARFLRCRFGDADLSEVITHGCVFTECDFSGVRLNGSEHHRTAFLRCRFRRTSWFAAVLTDCKLSGSTFVDGCVLRPLTVEGGGDWSYVSLRGQDLSGLDLSGVRLREADLSDADLWRAVLRRADLSYVRLHGTRLGGADLRGADLSGVRLQDLALDAVKLDIGQAAALATAYGAEVHWDTPGG